MIRVASVPASHVYVRDLTDPDGADAVVRLVDPVPADGRTVPGGWWPPLMLDPAWISRHHREFDVFHVHFGFDALSPATMEDVIHELSVHRKPLVYTLHDLRNPHHRDPAPHRAVLNVLVPAADAVITLTPGAAGVIEAASRPRFRNFCPTETAEHPPGPGASAGVPCQPPGRMSLVADEGPGR
jgi:hypothetical protein